MIAEEANQKQTENKNQNKELRMATEMKIRRMSDVQLQEVAWLWKPYIPFGKITMYLLLAQHTTTEREKSPVNKLLTLTHRKNPSQTFVHDGFFLRPTRLA